MEGSPRASPEPHKHGVGKFTSSTRKLVAKLGLTKKEKGSASPRGSSPSPSGTPRQPVTVAPTTALAGSAVYPGPLPPSPLGATQGEEPPSPGPLEPATPTPAAPEFLAASPLEAGLPGAEASPAVLQGGASPRRAPGGEAADARGLSWSPEELDTSRQRLARLREAADRASHVASIVSGPTAPAVSGPSAAERRPEARVAPPAPQPQQAQPPPNAPPVAPLEQQLAVGEVQAGGPAEAAAAGRSAPAALVTLQPDAAAAERVEAEGLALYHPVTDETRRGRLAAVVAAATPYAAAGQAQPLQPAALASAGTPLADAWRAAADAPEASVGGTTGATHVGGSADLAAARLHAVPKGAAQAPAAPLLPARPAATVGPASEEVSLAPYAAGAAPEKLDMGPFGSQVDVSLFSPDSRTAGSPSPGQVAPDRRTESEAVDVAELAERVQEGDPAPGLPAERPRERAGPGGEGQGGEAELREALETATVPGQQAEEAEGREAEQEAAAEAPVAASVATAAQETAAKAAQVEEAVRQAAAVVKARAGQAAVALKEGAGTAAAVAADKGAGAAAAARVTVERVAAAASDTAAAAGQQAGAAAQATKETAAAVADKAAAAKDSIVEGAGEAAAVVGSSVTGLAGAGEQAAEGVGALQPQVASPEVDVAAEDDPVPAQAPVEAEEAAPEAAAAEVQAPERGAAADAAPAQAEGPAEAEAGQEEQPGAGAGLAASLLGAAAQAAAAVKEQVTAVLQHGRQLAAERHTSPGGAGAGGLEGGSQGEGQLEAGGQEGGAGVLPVAAEPPQTMKEAVEQGPAVSDSLLQTLEGGEEPAARSAPPPAAATTDTPAPTQLASGAAGSAVVLPVGVTAADQRAVGAAAAASPMADASLAVEQDAPEVAAAELAEGLMAQPESLHAPPEYLAGRQAGGDQPGEGDEAGGRLQMKDLSGLPALGSVPAQPSEAGSTAGAEEASSRGEGPGPAEPAAGQEREPLLPQASRGGLREPPPSPDVSSSPAAGGVGDVAPPRASEPPAELKAYNRLQTGTTDGGSVTGEAPAIEDVGLPVAAPADRAAMLFRDVLGWGRANPVLAAGAVGAAPLVWMALNRAATAGERCQQQALGCCPVSPPPAFGDFGPILLLSGAIAIAASLIAWLVRWAGVSDSELEMIRGQAAAAAELNLGGAGGGAVAADPAPAGGGEEQAMLDASEPVGNESTEDLRRGADAGSGSGVLEAAKQTVAQAAEEAMAVVQPGGEQVGEVVQETESGGEEVEGEDPVASTFHAVTGAAKVAMHGVEALAGRAYQALSREAPGADVGGEGAPLKGLTEAEQEGGAGPPAERRLAPAPPDAAPRPAPPPSDTDASLERRRQAVDQSGYDSDSEAPGPVLKGVHFTDQTTGQAAASASQVGTDVPPALAARSAAKEEAVAEEAAAGRAEEEEPTIEGEAQPNLLARAAEAGRQMAASAAGAVGHAAEKATGTAPEQEPPQHQLHELQASIAQMEGERADDVAFQQASRRLGM